MSDAQMVQLRQHLDVIHDHFKQLYDPAADAPFAIKIESKITKRRHPLRQPPRTRSPRSTLQNPNQHSPANRGNLTPRSPWATHPKALDHRGPHTKTSHKRHPHNNQPPTLRPNYHKRRNPNSFAPRFAPTPPLWRWRRNHNAPGHSLAQTGR